MDSLDTTASLEDQFQAIGQSLRKAGFMVDVQRYAGRNIVHAESTQRAVQIEYDGAEFVVQQYELSIADTLSIEDPVDVVEEAAAWLSRGLGHNHGSGSK